MKAKRPKLWVLELVLIFSISFGCTYHDFGIYKSKGVITGPDMRLCASPCCGGWDITIDQQFYTFSELPSNSGIDLEKEKFPLPVKLNWENDKLGCNHIIVTQIARDQ